MGWPFHSAWSSRMQEYQATFPIPANFRRKSRTAKSVALNSSFNQARSPNFLNASKPIIVHFELGWMMKKSSSCAMI